jgi:6-phosphogluconolactonase
MIKTFKSTNEIAKAIAQMFLELMGKPGTQSIHIALSGGNTPKAIFSNLNKKYGSKLANNRFHFWWVDERCVPPADDESNYKWAYELWLKPIGIPENNIHRIKGENSPEIEAIRYSEEIKNYMKTENEWPKFDLIFLGLGDDGHTASIFPNQMNLLTSENWCEVATHPVSGQKRITFTGNVLNNARKIVIISTGESKAQMVRNIAVEIKPEYPASHIQPVNGDLIWLIDTEAARYL